MRRPKSRVINNHDWGGFLTDNNKNGWDEASHNSPDLTFGVTFPNGDGFTWWALVGGVTGDRVIPIHLRRFGDLGDVWRGSKSKLRFKVAQAIFTTDRFGIRREIVQLNCSKLGGAQRERNEIFVNTKCNVYIFLYLNALVKNVRFDGGFGRLLRWNSQMPYPPNKDGRSCCFEWASIWIRFDFRFFECRPESRPTCCLKGWDT